MPPSETASVQQHGRYTRAPLMHPLPYIASITTPRCQLQLLSWTPHHPRVNELRVGNSSVSEDVLRLELTMMSVCGLRLRGNRYCGSPRNSASELTPPSLEL